MNNKIMKRIAKVIATNAISVDKSEFLATHTPFKNLKYTISGREVNNPKLVSEEDIFYCNEDKINFSKKVICGLHKFTYFNVTKEKSSIEFIKNNIKLFKNKIIICDDISSGIVPLKKEDRIWREETGKCLQYLSKESSKVYRMFCGIPSVIKE